MNIWLFMHLRERAVLFRREKAFHALNIAYCISNKIRALKSPTFKILSRTEIRILVGLLFFIFAFIFCIILHHKHIFNHS